MEMSVYFSVYLPLLCIIAFAICIVLVRKNEIPIFFFLYQKCQSRTALHLNNVSIYFTFQTKQEGILIKYFPVLTFIGI